MYVRIISTSMYYLIISNLDFVFQSMSFDTGERIINYIIQQIFNYTNYSIYCTKCIYFLIV